MGRRKHNQRLNLTSGVADESMSCDRSEGIALDQDELVSVIVPAFNAEKWITETLSCIAAQTYSDIEVLVVDDGSTDSTPDLVNRFVESDARFHLITKSNGGVASARNLGIELARGRLIAPCDADDLWSSNKLELQVEAWKRAGPNVGLVYCRSASIDSDSLILELPITPLHRGRVLIDMCRANLIGNGSSTLMRRDAVLAAGGYDASLRVRNAEGCEDFKLYLQLSADYDFDYVSDYCVGYRQTPSNMSSGAFRMIRSQDIVIGEFLEQFPHLKREFQWNQSWFLNWLRRKSITNGRYLESLGMLFKMIMRYPGITARILVESELVPAFQRTGWDLKISPTMHPSARAFQGQHFRSLNADCPKRDHQHSLHIQAPAPEDAETRGRL